jgi:hypothetical protein
MMRNGLVILALLCAPSSALAQGTLPPVTERLVFTIPQPAHGLVVNDVVRYNGTAYVKARADNATNAEVAGIVSAVPNADAFTLHVSGRFTSLSGLSPGVVYYLSSTTSGALTSTSPSTTGTISKPVLIATSATAGYFVNWRGMVNSAVTPTVGGSAGQVQYNNAGAAGGITNATSDGTVMTLTTPKIATSIQDSSGNNWLGVTPTGSANYLSIANAATGNNPVISATGTDADIAILLTPKGVRNSRFTANGLMLGSSAGTSDYLTLNASNNANVVGRSGSLFGWTSSGTNANATVDTALGRDAAGVVQVNTGTAGSYGTLKADIVNAVTQFQINGVPFTGGGGGNVSNSGTPTANQIAQWTDATHIKGNTLSGSGATMSLDSSGVLTISAIANASLVNSSITIAGTSTALGGSVLPAPGSPGTRMTSDGTSWTAMANGNPISFYVSGVTVLTSGSPADIATITIPSWITRYASPAIGGGFIVYASAAAGTLAGASFTARDTGGGGGNAVTSAAAGPTAVNLINQANGASNTATFTGNTIYIRQTINSGFSGTCSFYVKIQPIL